jgi:superfamily II DNA helicase RecQ
MQSYADRRTHDFFFERDYPDISVLESIFNVLTPALQSKDTVQSRARMTGDLFDIALEKLWIHGGAIVDYAENISRGRDDFRAGYLAQREHKAAQFEKMLAYCESACCRMMALVRYFGDTADSRRSCGVCDFCDSEAVIAQAFRPATPAERAHADTILQALMGADGISTGRLYTQAFPPGGLDRRSFEDLLNAMARARLVEVIDASFEKDGRQIDFRKARITPEGQMSNAAGRITMPADIARVSRPRKTKKTAKSRASAQSAASSPLREALRAWRTAEAKKKGVPAFRIMADRVMDGIVAAQPADEAELLNVSGVGPKLVEKHGLEILRMVEAAG